MCFLLPALALSDELGDMTTEHTAGYLDWRPRPKGQYVPEEMLFLPAFQTLTASQMVVLLFIYQQKSYPSSKKKGPKKLMKMNFWKPLNEDRILASYEMFVKNCPKNIKPINEKTFRRSIPVLMALGFIDLVEQGGNGPRNANVYRITHNWRLWKSGDAPIFVKAGMSREKGFCKPKN